MENERPDGPIRVCLGFPPFHEARYIERLRQIDRVEPIVLPIDPDGEWATISPTDPTPEPPAWATTVAEERRSALERADVFVALHVPQNLSELAPSLRWIQGAGAGVEQFGVAQVDWDRVILTNASGLSAGSMAEWVLGRLLQVWKRFREADAYQERREFERTYGRTFMGSTLGIVGMGHIGRAVSQRVRPFGCRVLGLTRSAKPGQSSEDADELFTTDQLHAMLGQCDAVLISAPATPETHHLIDAKALAAIPRHAVLVNVARGSLVDEAELARVMREEPLAAAVLDVFEEEPLSTESPLWDIPNVYVSAHSSVSVDRYMDDVFDFLVDNLERYVSGRELRNIVSRETIE